MLFRSLAGVWKHAEEPGWIEIQFEDDRGRGTVLRNDLFPEREGRLLLRNLAADASKPNLWRGEIYVERFEEFKKAELKLDGGARMTIEVKVGFISRSLDWVRVDSVPDAAGN